MLVILTFYLACRLILAENDLFTQDGVLVQERDNVRTLAGIWTTYITINAPPRPEVTTRIQMIAAIIQGKDIDPLDIDATFEQRFLWLSRINRLKFINSIEFETEASVYEARWKRYASTEPLTTLTPEDNIETPYNDTLQPIPFERIVSFDELITDDNPMDEIMEIRRTNRTADIHTDEFDIDQDAIPSSTVPARRRRRGLLDVIGQVSKALFGTATEDDIASLKQTIDINNQQASILRHNQAQFLSIFNKTQAYVSENRDLIQNIHVNIERIQDSLNGTYNALASLDNRVRSIEIARIIDTNLNLLEEIMDEYTMRLQVFHNQQLQLERGWLTRDLLPLQHLTAILNQLRSNTLRTLASTWYYQHMNVIPIHDPAHLLGQLAFKVYIPGITANNFLHYQLNYFRVPVGEHQLRQVIGESDIAIDTANGYSFTLEQSRCLGANPTVCGPPRMRLAPTCETALLAGQMSPSCQFKFSDIGNLTLEFFQDSIFDNEIILVSYIRQSATLRCSGRMAQTLSILGPTKIQVDHSCNLITPDWKINGILLDRVSLQLVNKKYVTLKPLNISWPLRINRNVIQKIELTKVAELDWSELPTLKEIPLVHWQVTYFQRYKIIIGLSTLCFVLLMILIMVVCRKRIFKYCLRQISKRRDRVETPTIESIPLRPLPAIPIPTAPPAANPDNALLHSIGQFHQQIIPYYTSVPTEGQDDAATARRSLQIENNSLYEPVESRPPTTSNPRVKPPYENSTFKRVRVE